MKSENAARITVEVRGRGNEVKGCKGIPSLFSTVNHSASARDTKEPVCVCEGGFVRLNGAIGPQLDNEPPSLCSHATTSERDTERRRRRRRRVRNEGSGVEERREGRKLR